MKTYLRIFLSLYLRCFFCYSSHQRVLSHTQLFRRQGVSTHVSLLSSSEKTVLNLQPGLCSTHFFRAESTLSHMTIQVIQLRLNSNPKLANLTQL